MACFGSRIKMPVFIVPWNPVTYSHWFISSVTERFLLPQRLELSRHPLVGAKHKISAALDTIPLSLHETIWFFLKDISNIARKCNMILRPQEKSQSMPVMSVAIYDALLLWSICLWFQSSKLFGLCPLVKSGSKQERNFAKKKTNALIQFLFDAVIHLCDSNTASCFGLR